MVIDMIRMLLLWFGDGACWVGNRGGGKRRGYSVQPAQIAILSTPPFRRTSP